MDCKSLGEGREMVFSAILNRMTKIITMIMTIISKGNVQKKGKKKSESRNIRYTMHFCKFGSRIGVQKGLNGVHKESLRLRECV